MQLAAVTAGALVAGGYLFVHGGEQGAGAAGEVSDSQLADFLGARPVDPLQLGDGEPGKQCGGSWQGVEGGQEFAVGDESLENAAGQVVGVFDAGCVDALGLYSAVVAVFGPRRRSPGAARISLAMAKMGQ